MGIPFVLFIIEFENLFVSSGGFGLSLPEDGKKHIIEVLVVLLQVVFDKVSEQSFPLRLLFIVH